MGYQTKAALDSEKQEKTLKIELSKKQLEELKNANTVTEYPILHFDDEALQFLADGVNETLQYSEIQPNNGRIYRVLKRTMDISCASVALLLSAIPIFVFAALIYIEDGGNPFFHRRELLKMERLFECISCVPCVWMRKRSLKKCKHKIKRMA